MVLNQTQQQPHMFFSTQGQDNRTPLVIQWLGLCPSKAGAASVTPPYCWHVPEHPDTPSCPSSTSHNQMLSNLRAPDPPAHPLFSAVQASPDPSAPLPTSRQCPVCFQWCPGWAWHWREGQRQCTGPTTLPGARVPPRPQAASVKGGREAAGRWV